MHSKRRHEGWLLIDHSESPGLTDAELRTTWPLPLAGTGRGKFEAPTITCSHCQMVLVINPLRTRTREYCQKCDHYICDGCGTTMAVSGVCRTFKQVIDDAYETAMKKSLIVNP
jgi:hypothetical protein